MIVIGAKGHAREVLDILRVTSQKDKILFFDNITKYLPNETFYDHYIIKTIDEAEKILKTNPKFCLALGGSFIRNKLYNLFLSLGGIPVDVISPESKISTLAKVGNGLNMMAFSSILGNAIVGDGTLINAYASIHHDVHIGEFCEISPGARILGNCKIGKRCIIGSNAVILPGCEIVDDVVIGAGSVVTKNIISSGVYIGAPIFKIK